MKKILILAFLFSNLLNAQSITVLNSGMQSSIRGLSVVNDNVIWLSGSAGMVGLSLDGGNTWKWNQVKGFEKTDFRDIEAFDATTAVIMGIAEPAYMLRTVDGGSTWKVVYENKTKGIFLDAMEFWNDQSGIVIGDPIDGKFVIARTFDGGNSWQGIPSQNYPAADSGEACFASSGTNIRKFSRSEALFVSGGLHSRVFIRDKRIEIPIIQGKESTGANSIAVKNKKVFIVVGGDFTKPTETQNNCVITKDGGKSWTQPGNNPRGYRSCVEYLSKKNWISCGLNGVDYSADDGKNWKAISTDGFHVVRKAKDGKLVFLAGGNGKIGRLALAK